MVRTGRQAEAAAHVAAMRASGVAALSTRLALLAAEAAAITAPDDQANGLFEAALTIPGIDRWRFDLARVQLGAHLHRAFGKLGITTRVTLHDALAAVAEAR
jgi:hypothetical protein